MSPSELHRSGPQMCAGGGVMSRKGWRITQEFCPISQHSSRNTFTSFPFRSVKERERKRENRVGECVQKHWVQPLFVHSQADRAAREESHPATQPIT